MKWIKKMSTVFLPKIFGNIVDTTNITDKTSNTYSARVIESLVETGGGGGTDISTIVDLLYPVGRGFLDFTDTDYSNWLGLTWERELIGVTPIGYNPNDTDYSAIGKTGGSKTKTIAKENLPNYTLYSAAHTHIQNSHNHTQNAHSHSQSFNNDNGSSYVNDWVRSGGSSGTRDTRNTNATTATNNAATATNQNTTITVTSGGSGTALDIRSPYQVVSYWKRVDPNAKTTISFTIDGTTYQADSGMTWAEWCGSAYNTAGYYKDSDGIITRERMTYLAYNNTACKGTDLIIANGTYTTESVGPT